MALLRGIARLGAPHPSARILVRPLASMRHAYEVVRKMPLSPKQRDEVLEVLLDLEDDKVVYCRKLLAEKERNAAAKERARRLERALIMAMRSAGVADARSLLECIKNDYGLGSASTTEAWRVLLGYKPELVTSLARTIPSWSRGIEDKAQLKGVLASNVAALHSSLGDSSSVHAFVDVCGLIIYEGRPDEATARALACICRHFDVPHTLLPLKQFMKMI